MLHINYNYIFAGQLAKCGSVHNSTLLIKIWTISLFLLLSALFHTFDNYLDKNTLNYKLN